MRKEGGKELAAHSVTLPAAQPYNYSAHPHMSHFILETCPGGMFKAESGKQQLGMVLPFLEKTWVKRAAPPELSLLPDVPPNTILHH